MSTFNFVQQSNGNVEVFKDSKLDKIFLNGGAYIKAYPTYMEIRDTFLGRHSYFFSNQFQVSSAPLTGSNEQIVAAVSLAFSRISAGGGDVTGGTIIHNLDDVADSTARKAVSPTQVTSWDSKQSAGDYATNTALSTGLSGKAALTHSHTASQVVEDASHRFVTDTEKNSWNGKQATLVSGTNIKTLGGTSLLGTGDLPAPRATPRVVSVASAATPAPAGDTTDQYNLTALAVAVAFAAPLGTPTDGQELTIRVKDNGTARAITWNAIYRGGTDFTLPSTTVPSKTQYVYFIYNAADSKWDAVGYTAGI